MNLRYFKLAFADFQAVETLQECALYDRNMRNICAFHIEQCIEKVLKGYATPEYYYRDDCSIGSLIELLDDVKSDCIVTEWVRAKSGILTEWREAAQLNDLCITTPVLVDAIAFTKVFLTVNGISETLRPEITYAMKPELVKLYDFETLYISNLEFNLLYKLYCTMQDK